MDVVYHSQGHRLEFDFIVAPHADPSKIELFYEGQESLRLEDNGDLVFATGSGEIRQRKPVIYQETDGGKVEITGAYRIQEGAVSFALAQYDPARPLVIDPILEYGTYLGASGKANGRFRLALSPIAGAARYQYDVGRAGQPGPVLTGVTPGLYIDTSLAVTASTFHQAIVRACSFANASQCSPDSDVGWGPWSSGVTGTTGFTVVP